MRIYLCAALCTLLIGLAGCSSGAPASKSSAEAVVPAGEKAAVGHLSYNVVDSQIVAKLGDEASPRIPRDRYLLVQVAVTNSSNVDNPVPAIELLADSGKVYDELPDGTGVNNWFGVVRHVGPGQTERGYVIFDAPAAHYRLRFNDEMLSTEVLADLPLSYAHEQVRGVGSATDLPDVVAPPTATQSNKNQSYKK